MAKKIQRNWRRYRTHKLIQHYVQITMKIDQKPSSILC
jgi:hypothetical protein